MPRGSSVDLKEVDHLLSDAGLNPNPDSGGVMRVQKPGDGPLYYRPVEGNGNIIGVVVDDLRNDYDLESFIDHLETRSDKVGLYEDPLGDVYFVRTDRR